MRVENSFLASIWASDDVLINFSGPGWAWRPLVIGGPRRPGKAQMGPKTSQDDHMSARNESSTSEYVQGEPSVVREVLLMSLSLTLHSYDHVLTPKVLLSIL